MNRNLLIILIILGYALSQNTKSIQSIQRHNNLFLSSSLRMLSEELFQSQVNYFYRHMMDISIGTPPQLLRVKLSSSFCGLWIQDSHNFQKGFNSSQSTTFMPTLDSAGFEYVTGKVVQDTVKFIETTNEQFPFLLVNHLLIQEESDYQGIIGFGYHCDFSNRATTDVLTHLNNNSNDKLHLFHFRLNTEDNRGWFAIGQWPNGFQSFSQYYRRTPIDATNTSGQWKVMLDSIYFEDGQFLIIKDHISIGIGGAILSVTKQVFLQVVDKYLRRLINSSECAMNSQKVYEVICNQNVTPPSFGVISFVVGKWNFKVKSSELFIKITRDNDQKLWFAMVHYPKQNEFYISQVFLRGINIIYDKEKKEIGFYDKTH